MSRAAQFEQGGTLRAAGDDEEMARRQHQVPWTYQGPGACLLYVHHAPAAHELPSCPHEKGNIMAIAGDGPAC